MTTQDCHAVLLGFLFCCCCCCFLAVEWASCLDDQQQQGEGGWERGREWGVVCINSSLRLVDKHWEYYALIWRYKLKQTSIRHNSKEASEYRLLSLIEFGLTSQPDRRTSRPDSDNQSYMTQWSLTSEPSGCRFLHMSSLVPCFHKIWTHSYPPSHNYSGLITGLVILFLLFVICLLYTSDAADES